jgi:DNA-binding PadR family transcriptional regulator
MIDSIILATLWDEAKHGYRVKKEAGLLLGLADLHNNIVYPLLRRFTAEGLVRKKAAPGQRGQMRQVYALTPRGRRTLIERLSAFGAEEAKSPEEFLLRVGMFEALAPEARARILQERAGALRARIEALQRVREQLAIDEYGSEVIEYLLERLALELRWIERQRGRPRRRSK